MTHCKYFESCPQGNQSDLCTETPQYCKISNDRTRFRVRLSSFKLEEEILDMIELNGMNRYNENLNTGK